MEVKWDTPLKDGQLECPVVSLKRVDLPDGFIYPTDDMLAEVFKGKGHQLRTWGRTQGVKVDDPHWIGVKGQTPLHWDPAYPRYSHHLKIRVDEWAACRGMNKIALKMTRGLFYILDTHSPHQVISKDKKWTWNVAISLDSHEIRDTDETIAKLIEYGENAPWL